MSEKQQPIKAICSNTQEMTNAVIAAVLCGDGLLKTLSCLRSWLRINSAIKKRDCRIGLLNVPKFNCDLDALHSETCERGRRRQEVRKNGAISSCGDLTKFHILIHTVPKTSSSNDWLWISTGHFKSAPNCFPATSAMNVRVCANPVSIGSEAVKWRWVV